MAILNPKDARRYNQLFDAVQGIDPDTLTAAADRYKLDITTLGSNGVIKLNDRHFLVQEVALYHETDETFNTRTGESWPEYVLLELSSGEKLYLEWEEDDEISMYVTETQLRFSDLSDDANGSIDEDDLDQISEEEDSVFYNGKKYGYDDDYAATYQASREEKPAENAFFYEFLDKNANCITIEEWEVDRQKDKYEYQLFHSRKIDPDMVEIISTGQSDAN